MNFVKTASFFALLAFNIVACGADKKTEAKSADEAPAAAAPTPVTPESVPNTSSASAVHISPEITKACGIAAPDAFFAFDSANLRPQDARVLDAVAACFSSGPLSGQIVKLVGHTDPRGAGEYNMALGQQRADSVSSYLVQKGVAQGKAQSTSRGAMDASGTDEAGWAKDRSVDIMVGH